MKQFRRMFIGTLMVVILMVVFACATSTKGGGRKSDSHRPSKPKTSASTSKSIKTCNGDTDYGYDEKSASDSTSEDKPEAKLLRKKEDRPLKTKDDFRDKEYVTKEAVKNGLDVTMNGDTTATEKTVANGHDDATPSTTKQLHIPKAGQHDDNEEFQYFLKFVNEKINSSYSKWGNEIKEKIQKRNVLAVYDKNNLPLRGAKVKIGRDTFTTYQDGEIFFYPKKLEKQGKPKTIIIEYKGKSYKKKIAPQEYGRNVVNLDIKRVTPKEIPIDIVFLMDTTGSMGDEIAMLRDTLYSIYMRIKKVSAGTKLKIRYAMVLYRDDGDEYLTKTFKLNSSIDKFQKFLFEVEAGGGGDYPEHLVAGLEETLKLNWQKNAIKLVFQITDAPAQLKTFKKIDEIAQKAINKNIKIFSIGASGLDQEGEVHLRLFAQLTKGKFIFMTYGEKGESSGSATHADPGKVSHHTGGNYESRNLDDIIVDNVKREILYQSSEKAIIEINNKFDYKGTEDMVYRRVDNIMQQLKKQAPMDGTKTVLVLPPDTENKSLESLSEHVTSVVEQIVLKEKYLKIVDRSKMQEIVKEMKLKLIGLVEGEENLKDIAKADTILFGKLYFVGNQSVLFMKLMDAESSEVIAAAMVKM